MSLMNDGWILIIRVMESFLDATKMNHLLTFFDFRAKNVFKIYLFNTKYQFKVGSIKYQTRNHQPVLSIFRIVIYRTVGRILTNSKLFIINPKINIYLS